MVIVDEEGNIKYTNQEFLNVFGYQQDEIQGEHIIKIIPPDLRDAHNIGFSRYQTTGVSKIMGQDLNLKAIKKSGEIFNATQHIISGKQNETIEIGATIIPSD